MLLTHILLNCVENAIIHTFNYCAITNDFNYFKLRIINQLQYSADCLLGKLHSDRVQLAVPFLL